LEPPTLQTIDPTHIQYGHYDEKGTGPLTFFEHLKVCMDKLAKSLVIPGFGRIPFIPPAVPLIGIGFSTFQKSLT
jgi:hypothetical protein